jgi:hypothetical protein
MDRCKDTKTKYFECLKCVGPLKMALSPQACTPAPLRGLHIRPDEWRSEMPTVKDAARHRVARGNTSQPGGSVECGGPCPPRVRHAPPLSRVAPNQLPQPRACTNKAAPSTCPTCVRFVSYLAVIFYRWRKYNLSGSMLPFC